MDNLAKMVTMSAGYFFRVDRKYDFSIKALQTKVPFLFFLVDAFRRASVNCDVRLIALILLAGIATKGSGALPTLTRSIKSYFQSLSNVSVWITLKSLNF